MMLILELASIGSLRSWRKKHHGTVLQWKVIIFQTCYTLAVLSHYMGIRHNDTHQGNILLDEVPTDPSMCEGDFFSTSIIIFF